jgi:hypothetical protein
MLVTDNSATTRKGVEMLADSPFVLPIHLVMVGADTNDAWERSSRQAAAGKRAFRFRPASERVTSREVLIEHEQEHDIPAGDGRSRSPRIR